jgi:hypothetical protein
LLPDRIKRTVVLFPLGARREAERDAPSVSVQRVLAVGVALATVGAGAPAWAGDTERASVGPGGRQGDRLSENASLSADGRFVAFESSAANLVPGDTNDTRDIFVRDRRTNRTRRVSLGPNDVEDIFVHDPPHGPDDAGQRRAGRRRGRQV